LEKKITRKKKMICALKKAMGIFGKNADLIKG
jgi:hypothetical protein